MDQIIAEGSFWTYFQNSVRMLSGLQEPLQSDSDLLVQRLGRCSRKTW